MINLDKLFPPNSKKRKFLKNLLIHAQWVPKSISKNFKKIDQSSLNLIKISLENNFFQKVF